MAGLYFKYGTMNSSKSANLLMIKHNYEEQNFTVKLLKPSTDTREKETIIHSRVGLSAPCTLINDDSDLTELCKDYKIVMVDEAQFLSEKLVDELYEISYEKVVMCFGLMTDFKRNLFPGSKRLIELCDSLQEIKSVCSCGRRAVVNARFKDGKLVLDGAQVEIGAEDKYRALCKYCYHDLLVERLKEE